MLVLTCEISSTGLVDEYVVDLGEQAVFPTDHRLARAHREMEANRLIHRVDSAGNCESFAKFLDRENRLPWLDVRLDHGLAARLGIQRRFVVDVVQETSRAEEWMRDDAVGPVEE